MELLLSVPGCTPNFLTKCTGCNSKQSPLLLALTSPLMTADQVAWILLDHGADIRGDAILMAAVKAGREEWVELLLSRGADLSEQEKKRRKKRSPHWHLPWAAPVASRI